MTEIKGIDIAWERPSIAQILATGAHWVARYFSPDASKNLTASEVVAYPAAGLAIVTVYESTAARATQGRAAGVADAQLAERQRKDVGLPDSHVHHFAVDSDVTWAAVAPYFAGVLSVLPLSRVGCYGGYQVIAGAHGAGIRYLWQTVAWSGGRWHPSATIRQPGGMLLGGAADVDYAEVPDFGQFPRPSLETDVNLNDKMPPYATIKVPGKPDYLPTVGECLNGAKQADAKVDALGVQVAALTAKVTALGSALSAGGVSDAQLTVLAGKIADILSQRLAN